MAHAVLSPSAASRWMACTPSARLEQEFEDTGSVYANEGTLAHKFCELFLRKEKKDVHPAAFIGKLAKLKEDKLFNPEMIGYAEEFRDHVVARWVPGSHLFIEEKLDMSNLVPEGFGTGDAIIIADGTLRLFDYKHGKGVEVSAVKNSQMMLYALGALNMYGAIFEITEVEMTIFQPRIGNISEWSIPAQDLVEWGENEVKPAAKLAYAGEGEYAAGDHCMFCKAKAQCRALRDHNMKLAAMEFTAPELLTDEEIIEVLKAKELFTSWLKAVDSYTLAEAIKGKKWQGFKVVEGRSKRSYIDEEKVAKVLKKAGFKDIYKPKAILGITDMTKSIGKPAFAKHVDPLCEKPAGKPTLVPASDSRPEFNSAKVAFEGIEIPE